MNKIYSEFLLFHRLEALVFTFHNLTEKHFLFFTFDTTILGIGQFIFQNSI
jgi:hypothetical protein